MRVSNRYLTMICSALLVLAGFSSQAAAQVLFTDDFEDRVADQAVIGPGWTWYLMAFTGNTCVGTPDFEWGPWSDGNGDDFLAANRNYQTANNDGSYYRAGLEVPAWDGALTNMLRVYGDQYLTWGDGCERVLIFQELPIASIGDFTFSFDVAQSQYGYPENGEITGAFLKVLRSSDNSYATLWAQEVPTNPPGGAVLAPQSIEFTIPAEYVGELLQFGFYNDVAENLGQSWTTSAATYDNIEVARAVVVPPEPDEPDVDAIPIPFWASVLIAGLLAYFGGTTLRRRRNT